MSTNFYSLPAPVLVYVNGYLLDVTSFNHPGGPKKISNLLTPPRGAKLRKNFVDPVSTAFTLPDGSKVPDASHDFNTHFGHTVNTLREATKRYDRQFPKGEGRMEVEFGGRGGGSYEGSVWIVRKIGGAG